MEPAKRVMVSATRSWTSSDRWTCCASTAGCVGCDIAVVYHPASVARRRPGDQRPADLPVVAEGVPDPAESPAVLLDDGVDHGGAGGDGPVEHGIGVVHDQQQP